MKLQHTLSAIALAAAGLASATAHATTTCSTSDISPNAVACSGFYDGNVLNNSPANVATQTSALSALGFAWDGTTVLEILSPLAGNHTVDFATLLQGDTFVAIHFGNGTGGPGNATAFYKLNAGAGLDTFTLNYNASSNAWLYSTTPVPEPETYALMLAGLGAVGFMTRRRRVA